jgi:hypothetical protein
MSSLDSDSNCQYVYNQIPNVMLPLMLHNPSSLCCKSVLGDGVPRDARASVFHILGENDAGDVIRWHCMPKIGKHISRGHECKIETLMSNNLGQHSTPAYRYSLLRQDSQEELLFRQSCVESNANFAPFIA